MKLSLVINKEINSIIDAAANKMGTSKRNIISLALTSVLDQPIEPYEIDEMKENIKLDYVTSITISEHMNQRINECNMHGLSKRLFIGYVVCDYFYKNYSKFITKEELSQTKQLNTTKNVVQVYTDEKIKRKLLEYCNENSISLSALVSHYLVNKEIKFNSYEINKKVLVNLSLGNDMKSIVHENAKKFGITTLFYLNIVLFQIYDDLIKC